MGAHSKRGEERTRLRDLRRAAYRGRHGDGVDITSTLEIPAVDDPLTTVVDPATDRREAGRWLLLLAVAAAVLLLSALAAWALGGGEYTAGRTSAEVSPSRAVRQARPPSASARPSPAPRATVEVTRTVPGPRMTVTVTDRMTVTATHTAPGPTVTVTATRWVLPTTAPTAQEP